MKCCTLWFQSEFLNIFHYTNSLCIILVICFISSCILLQSNSAAVWSPLKLPTTQLTTGWTYGKSLKSWRLATGSPENKITGILWSLSIYRRKNHKWHISDASNLYALFDLYFAFKYLIHYIFRKKSNKILLIDLKFFIIFHFKWTDDQNCNRKIYST